MQNEVYGNGKISALNSRTQAALTLSFFVFAMLLNNVGIVVLELFGKVANQRLGLLQAFKDLPIAVAVVFSIKFISKIGYAKTIKIALLVSAVFCISLAFVKEFWFYKIWFAAIGIAFYLLIIKYLRANFGLKKFSSFALCSFLVFSLRRCIRFLIRIF